MDRRRLARADDISARSETMVAVTMADLMGPRARRRERISRLSVLSTTHLRGSTTNPVVSSERLTISSVRWRFSAAQSTRRLA